MSEKPNDSPAFRLRPRSEPKSYYTIRLEYSANPAAFTRERPRSSLTKRRSTSTKSTYSRSRSNKTTAKTGGQHGLSSETYQGSPVKSAINVMSKEDIEREERHKRIERNVSESVKMYSMISPFLQRLELEQLKPSSSYEQNYITLKIEEIIKLGQQADQRENGSNRICEPTQDKHFVCKCCGTDKSAKNLSLDVHLYNEFAREDMLALGKYISIAKFSTSPARPQADDCDPDSSKTQLPFDVIVKYEGTKTTSSSSSTITSCSTSSGIAATRSKKPLLPYMCISDMIEEPTDLYVEMPPPSPPLAPQPTPCKPDSDGDIVGDDGGIGGGGTNGVKTEATEASVS